MPIDVTDPRYGAQSTTGFDNTVPFQAALNEAEKSGDVVFVPPGNYGFNGSLRVPAYVTLEGSWRAPSYSLGNPEPKGTILEVYAGRSEEDGPAFIQLMGHAAGIKGLIIHYPEQPPPKYSSPWP